MLSFSAETPPPLGTLQATTRMHLQRGWQQPQGGDTSGSGLRLRGQAVEAVLQTWLKKRVMVVEEAAWVKVWRLKKTVPRPWGPNKGGWHRTI